MGDAKNHDTGNIIIKQATVIIIESFIFSLVELNTSSLETIMAK